MKNGQKNKLYHLFQIKKKRVCFVVHQKGRGASEYTSWPFALTGHMVQSPPYSGWQKSVASSTGTSKTKESQA